MPHLSTELALSELFSVQHLENSSHSRAELGYLRAEAIAKAHALDINDILRLSPAFWEMHRDPIVSMDGAATTLLTIQYNLTIGTLAYFVQEEGRDDLRKLVDSLLQFNTIGQYSLTEVGHGLASYNLETTATLLENGSFELHTPSASAAKFMPPMVPVLGRPCVSVVFAQLVVNQERRGVRPFLVNINDGNRMCPGISARLLPYRHGADPVNHSITSFHRVILPQDSLLGSIEDKRSSRLQFLTNIWRISVGTLALSAVIIPGLQVASSVVYKYSVLREIGDYDGTATKLISFRTQAIPILYTVARAYALDAMYRDATAKFADETLDPRVRHGIATCFKSISFRCAQRSYAVLLERCGARGLFAVNQLAPHSSELPGIGVAEGDILALSIRLATELLLDRYALPPAKDPTSLISQHETDLFQYCQWLVKKYGHRSKEFSRHVMPVCQKLVESIGFRMAYEAACDAGVAAPLIEMFLLDAIQADFGWYVERGDTIWADFGSWEANVMDKCMPMLPELIEKMEVEAYVHAPMASPEGWDSFVNRLPIFSSPSSPQASAQIIRASL